MKLKMVILLCTLCVNSYAVTERITIIGSLGKLSATIQRPTPKVEDKCPMVMLLHGFMGSQNGIIEESMANALEDAGIATIRFDFNGHGNSEGEFENMTLPNEIEDAKCVYEYIAKLPYVSQIAISGHSQGGVVTAMLAGELGNKKVNSIVLMAPAAVLRDDAIRGNTMGARYNPLDPPATIELFNGKRLGAEYIKTAFWLPIYETAKLYDGPACIIHGIADNIVPYTYGERFHELWPNSEWHLMPDADHGFSKHIDETTSIAVSFLKAHLLSK